MSSLHQERHTDGHRTLPRWVTLLIDRAELTLIVAMAILLPFDHWFFGHMVNPAPMRVLGFVLTGVWLLQFMIRPVKFTLQSWHIWILVFLGTCFYSAVYSTKLPGQFPFDSTLYKFTATIKIAAAMLFLVLACLMLRRDTLLLFLRIHLFNGTIICTVSLALYFLHLYGIWPRNFALWVDSDIYNFVRIQGVSFEPQRFGAYMLTQLPFFLSRDLRKQIGWPCSNLDTLILFIMLATVFLSYALSTYLVLPIMLLFLFGTSRAHVRKLVWVFVGSLLMAVVLLSVPVIRDATFEIIKVKLQGESIATRLHNWQVAIDLFKIFPWVGVGPESYSYFYLFFDPAGINATPASHPPHSLLFGLLANLGIPGTLAFFSLIIAFGIALVKRLKAIPQNRDLAYTLAVIALIHFLVQFTIWLPWSLNQWLYMAMAWVAAQPLSPSPSISTARIHHAEA